ncbi:MAG: heme biosynthesis HemY N-terminal domain-containing protein [Bauldia sp.]
MARVLVFVIVVFLAAAGFAWLADRPGAIVLTWQGYEIRASIMVAAIAAAIVIAALALVGAIIRAIVTTPRNVGHFLGARRRDRGWRALSRGMIAVGAGDVRLARRSAEESRTLLGGEPLALLLSAQAAQLAGDAPGARSAFEALSARPDTRLLGLHGLFVEARRQCEREAARHFAEEAAKAAPRIGWAGVALFEYRSQAGDWQGALQVLSSNTDARLIEKPAARRLRAVLLTARAMQLESGEPTEARALALEAHRLAPDLVPAAVTAGRLLSRVGEVKRATKVLESGWRAFPHPEIAEAYASVRPGDSARDRLKRMRRLAELRANHPEGAIAIARAAIDAREWTAAREALEGLVRAGPSERVCMLMAEIEEREHGDQGRVRGWLTRAFNAPRDPAWVADGQAFERWAPVSPVSRRVDAFEWTVKAAALPAKIEIEAEPEAIQPPTPPPAVSTPAERRTIASAAKAEAPKDVPVIIPPKPGSGLTPQETESPPRQVAPPAAKIAPLTLPAVAKAAPAQAKPPAAPAPSEIEPALPRAPDDPGPEPATAEAPPSRRGFRLF